MSAVISTLSGSTSMIRLNTCSCAEAGNIR
jgi:hypothetical protein